MATQTQSKTGTEDKKGSFSFSLQTNKNGTLITDNLHLQTSNSHRFQLMILGPSTKRKEPEPGDRDYVLSVSSGQLERYEFHISISSYPVPILALPKDQWSFLFPVKRKPNYTKNT